MGCRWKGGEGEGMKGIGGQWEIDQDQIARNKQRSWGKKWEEDEEKGDDQIRLSLT